VNHGIGGGIDHRDGVGARVGDVQLRTVGCERQPVGLGTYGDVFARLGDQSIGDAQGDYRDGAADSIGDICLRAVRQDGHTVWLDLYRHFGKAAIAILAQVEEADAVVVGIDGREERVVGGERERLGGGRTGEARGPLRAYRLLGQPHPRADAQAGGERHELPVVALQKGAGAGAVSRTEQRHGNQAGTEQHPGNGLGNRVCA